MVQHEAWPLRSDVESDCQDLHRQCPDSWLRAPLLNVQPCAKHDARPAVSRAAGIGLTVKLNRLLTPPQEKKKNSKIMQHHPYYESRAPMAQREIRVKDGRV